MTIPNNPCMMDNDGPPLSKTVSGTPTTSFLSLPREVRDQIYRQIFECPFSAIKLQQRHRFTPLPGTHKRLYQIHSSEVTIFKPWRLSLCILRACKLIYEECKDLLWRYNTLDLTAGLKGPTPFNSTAWYDDYVWEYMKHNVGKVYLDMDYLNYNDDTNTTLRALSSWASEGKLHLVTLKATIRFLPKTLTFPRLHHILALAQKFDLSICQITLRVEKVNSFGDDPILWPDTYAGRREQLRMLSQQIKGDLYWGEKVVFNNGTEIHI